MIGGGRLLSPISSQRGRRPPPPLICHFATIFRNPPTPQALLLLGICHRFYRPRLCHNLLLWAEIRIGHAIPGHALHLHCLNDLPIVRVQRLPCNSNFRIPLLLFLELLASPESKRPIRVRQDTFCVRSEFQEPRPSGPPPPKVRSATDRRHKQRQSTHRTQMHGSYCMLH